MSAAVSIDQQRSVERAALLATGVDAVGTGAYVSAAVVLFTSYLNVSASIVGLGLTLSAVTGMCASLPVAAMADRFGVLRVFTAAYLARAVGTLLWIFVSGDLAFILFSLIFGAVDRSAASLTRSLIVGPLPRDASIRLMGATALPGNIGYSVGAGLSVAILALHLPALIVFVANSSSFVLVVFIYRKALRDYHQSLQSIKKPSTPSWGRIKSAFGNAARRRATAENFGFSFHRTLLNVFFPLAIVTYVPSYLWLVPGVFVVNATVVALTQKRVNTWAAAGQNFRGAWASSGFLISLSMLIIPALEFANGAVLVTVLTVFLVVQILAELLQSAGLSVLMVQMSRSDNLATDMSALNLGGQFQNILGPTMFSVVLGPVGWIASTVFGLLVGGAAFKSLSSTERYRSV